MRRIRIFALGIVSFFAVLMSALLAPGTIVNRALSAALCTVFSFNSTICTVNLAKSSDLVVAATPPAVERNISDWLVQRSPGEFDDAPSVPPFPQDPGPNIIRPEFDDPGSRIDPSLVRPSPPSPDVDRAIDSATENATGEAFGLLTEKCDFSSVGTSREAQKCFGAAGNQCEGGLPGVTGKNPRYNYDMCMVEAFVSTGSEAHDNCCVDDPRGYACDGYGNPNHTEYPNNSTLDFINSPCEVEWRTARNDVALNRGRWQTYGPYFRRRQQTAQKPETQNSQQAKSCRVPAEFFDKHKRVVVSGISLTDYTCVIKGPVMTNQGHVDGITACGVCSRFGNGLPPSQSSCKSKEIDPDRYNEVPTCPSNWDGGS